MVLGDAKRVDRLRRASRDGLSSLKSTRTVPCRHVATPRTPTDSFFRSQIIESMLSARTNVADRGCPYHGVLPPSV